MSNEEQIAYWDGEGGARWSGNADRLDLMLQPFLPVVLDAAGVSAGAKVLDIGCGAGSLSLAAAERGAEAFGVDVSSELVAIAKNRAAAKGAAARFELADAAAYRCADPVDAVVSRFGVMFFDAPQKAFEAIRANAKPGAPLAFACWRSIYDNAWARQPFETLLPFLKEPPQRPAPDAPGPFSFADETRVRGILEGAGWSDVVLTERRGAIELPGATPRETAEFAITIGPASRLLQDQDLPVEPVIEALAKVYESQAGSDGVVSADSSTWIVTARA